MSRSLGSANNINNLHLRNLPVSRPCPVGILVRGREPTRLPLPGGSRCPPKASRGLGSYLASTSGAPDAASCSDICKFRRRRGMRVWRLIRSRTQSGHLIALVRAHRLPRLWRLLQQVAAFLHLRRVESQCLHRRCIEQEATSLLVSYKKTNFLT